MAHYVLHQFSNNAKPREKDKKACFSYESTCRGPRYIRNFFSYFLKFVLPIYTTDNKVFKFHNISQPLLLFYETSAYMGLFFNTVIPLSIHSHKIYINVWSSAV